MRNYIFVLLLFTGLFQLASSPLQAQSDSMSVSLGTGWNHSKILDEFISPMQYKGGGYLFRAGLDEYNDSYYNHFEIIYQNNTIEPELDNESSAVLHRKYPPHGTPFQCPPSVSTGRSTLHAKR